MVLIKEYRIPLPFTLDEFNIGHVYMSLIAAKKASLVNNSDIKIIEKREIETQIYTQCPFSFSSEEESYDKYSFHHRILTATSSIPTWGKVILKGRSVLDIDEKSWQAFPYIKTVYKVPFFNDRFSITVISNHSEDMKLSNALNLSKQDLKKRIVDWVDIVEYNKNNYVKEEDPRLYKSIKTGRGPLSGSWPFSQKPIMCAYKCVKVESNFWGLNSKIENYAQEIIRNVYLQCHQQVFCSIDDWIDLSREYICKELTITEEENTNSSKKVSKRGWLKARL